MTKALLLPALLGALTLASGCSYFKKSDKPKENPAIASEVEETFRKRWVEKRVSELAAQGVAAEAARTQAENEFREKYGFEQGRRK